MSNFISFTPEGLAELARIVKQARGNTPYAEFGFEVGVSYTTIWRIEKQERGRLQLETLAALARSPKIGYGYEELIRICTGKQPEATEPLRTFLTAEELMPAIMELPVAERQRLICLVAAEVDVAQMLETMEALMQELKKKLGSDRC